MNIKLSAETLAALGNPANAADARTTLDSALSAVSEFRTQIDAAVTDANTRLDALKAASDEAVKNAADAKAGIAALVGDSDKIKGIAEAAASTIAGQALAATGNTPVAKTDEGAEGATEGAEETKLADRIAGFHASGDYKSAFEADADARAKFADIDAYTGYHKAVAAGAINAR